MRINKFISLSGVASRRAADDLVRDGRVQVQFTLDDIRRPDRQQAAVHLA